MGNKMWSGRESEKTSMLCDKYNSSINVDKRMYKEDIRGSIAHSKMLSKQGIISRDEGDKIVKGLEEILVDIEKGNLEIDLEFEDIHMFIESELTKRIGDTGKKVHTGRSRNDQVTLDFRLYLNKEINLIIEKEKELINILFSKAKENIDTLMPGYTHLQRAQPITLGFHLSAYINMLLRDIDRFKGSIDRLLISPIGSCALSGTTYNTDRFYEADLLEMKGVCLNAMDGVSDRDYALEFLSNASINMMHLSRFAEEIILWTSKEFDFIILSDKVTTGSSIMPQKKNSDMAELVRGKTGRVYGNMITLFTVLKGLPLAYNKDMQEDKEVVFNSIDILKDSIDIFSEMLASMSVNKEKMKDAVKYGYLNATDMADYLTSKGLPFRDAYKITGMIVKYAVLENKALGEISLEKLREYSDLFNEDIWEFIDEFNGMNRRDSFGGTSIKALEEALLVLKEEIEKV